MCADLAARAMRMTQERTENALDGTGHSSSLHPPLCPEPKGTEKEGRNLKGESPVWTE